MYLLFGGVEDEINAAAAAASFFTMKNAMVMVKKDAIEMVEEVVDRVRGCIGVCGGLGRERRVEMEV